MEKHHKIILLDADLRALHVKKVRAFQRAQQEEAENAEVVNSVSHDNDEGPEVA